MVVELAKKPEMSYWCEQIEAYERDAKTWESRSKKIIRRYTDDRTEAARKISRFNILWSNVQTLHPALYDGTPTPNVDRRFEDDEEVNTTVAQILERSGSYFVKTNDFDDCMNQSVLDYLLSGRGTIWVRYSPNFKDIQITGNEEVRGDGLGLSDDVTEGDDAPEQELYSESVVLDYVHWQDFGHCVSRTWQENRAVWRRVFMARKELIERFGDKGKNAPLDARALGRKDDDKSEMSSRSTIYEIWDRKTKKVYWLHKEMEDFLDVQDDPLRIDGFFPCPKPIYATLGNDSLIPTPDFLLYQDQANELDMLTGRIDVLTRALKVVGVYDASAEGVQRMLSENQDNKLIPVEQWAMFAEKGGINGVVNFFPLEIVINTLTQMYAARDKIKQDIYEITGISDIVRGATNANETATAQQIKGKFATLRLDNRQKEVARFSRDAVRIMIEIIAEHFSLDTLKKISGVRLLSQQEKQMAMMSQQPQMGPDGQPMPPKPLPDNIQKLLKKPTWEEIEAVLRENGARCFRVDIETDSTIKADQDAEKQSRVEFLTAAGGFIREAAQVQVPELQPLLMEMLKFGVGGFKAGRELETEFKVAVDAIKERAEAPPQPSQADIDAQAEQKKQEAMMAAKQQEAQANLAIKQQESMANIEIKRQESAANLEIKRFEVEAATALKNKQALWDAKSKASPDVLMVDEDLNEGQSPLAKVAEMMQLQAEQTSQALIAIGQMQAENQAQLIDALTRQKTVNIQRDRATGKMISAEVV